MLQQSIPVGATLNFTTRVPDYPANESWVLHYRLIPRAGSGAAVEMSSIPDAADATLHRIQVPAATTATWAAGHYSWAAWVEKSGEVYDVATGSVRLLPDPRTATAPIDLRTDAAIALAAAEAALAAWSPTTKSYTIGGRSMTFNSPGEIIPIISYWKAAVQREQRADKLARGMPDPRKVQVRLGRV
jgi:hypothetical protein